MEERARLSRLRRRRNNVKGWALMAPSLLFMGLFTFYPFLKTVVLSFYKQKLSTPVAVYNGIKNYERVFSDPGFARSVSNTLIFCAVVIPCGLMLGLLLAYLLNKRTPGRTTFRAMIFYPNISPMVGFYLVWMYLLAGEIGYVNRIFQIVGLPTRNWLHDPRTVLYAIAVIYLWRESGYMMLFYLSGLQSIDITYYEAAALDGASEWDKFRRITFPLLMPTTVFTVTLSITNAVQVVDVISILTNGGPNNASSMVMYYVYKTTFSNFDYGMAAAYSVMLLIVVLTVICFQNFGLDKITHYES